MRHLVDRSFSSHSRGVTGLVVGFGVALTLVGGQCAPKPPAPPPFERTEVRADCTDYNARRNPYFGDTHVHGTYSLDATLQDTRSTPTEEYGFAKGAPLGIPPYDSVTDLPTRTVQIDRPLDFTMLSDHSEFLGEVFICSTFGAGYSGFFSAPCKEFRNDPFMAFFTLNSLLAANQASVSRNDLICQPDDSDCLAAAANYWGDIQTAAETHYDRTSACTFTTFVGYEWSGNPALANLHRNVMFRNADVPALPVSYFDAPYPEDLWDGLEQDCLVDTPGCDVLTIPHNSNLAIGRMFEQVQKDGSPLDSAYVARRHAFEPLVEITQHKGASECLVSASPSDELCGYESLPFNNIAGFNLGPPVREDFVRYAMQDGMALQDSLGANPFQYGLIGSTDTHLGTPGLVEESASYPGHSGQTGTTDVPLTDNPKFNPGGLAVVWAEENSRDALFAAMERRETYATSGPRMIVRFFGGWKLPSDLCSQNQQILKADEMGVPMGAELPARTATTAPKFYVSAQKDAGTLSFPGSDLQRVQIVKGWVDDGGATHEQVYEVAGDPNNGASVDTTTCAQTGGAGFADLCTVWEDPAFDPDDRAYYYARVVENPQCRWSQRQCIAASVDCAVPATILPGLEECCDGSIPLTQQERAWTSPIWFQPESTL